MRNVQKLLVVAFGLMVLVSAVQSARADDTVPVTQTKPAGKIR